MSASITSVSDRYTKRAMVKLTWDWTSAAGGTISDAAEDIVCGLVRRIVTVPDTGATQPDNDYNLTLDDADGCDVASASLVDRDKTLVEHVVLDPPVPVNGLLTLSGDSCGAATGGTVIVYIE